MSKTKRALPEDIDITSPADNDYSPAEQAHDEAEAMAEMVLWDAAKNLVGKTYLALVVFNFEDSCYEQRFVMASGNKPTVQQILATYAKHSTHSESNLIWMHENGTVMAYTKPMDLYHVEEPEQKDIPF